MGRFIFVVLCSVVAALALCFGAQGRLGCKGGGIDCLRTELPSPNYANEKVLDYFKGLKPLDREAAADVDLFGSGLRWVPSGPDPLHHHGSPKKPETP